jgi:hypothetical protein
MSDATRDNFSHRLRYTPMRDLLRGRVSGRLDLNDRLAAANLPGEIRELIRRVIRKTRLWSLEKMDVANELIAHFSDGLESGATAQQLVESFGNEKTATKLIRRAKRRNRPLIWHAFIWLRNFVALLILTYLLLGVYFYLGKPTPKIDYIAVLNEPLEKIPQDQRAWPLYRQALLMIYETKDADANHLFDLMDAKPDSQNWTSTVNWLQSHQDVLKLIRQAAQKPVLGFVLGPQGSANDPQLFPGTKDYLSNSDGLLISLPLSHLNEMRMLATILNGDAMWAAQSGDSQKLVEDVDAIVRMADQLQGSNFLITDLVAVGIRSIALDNVENAAANFPSMLSDAQIQSLAHRVAKPDNDAQLVSFRGERMIFRDVVQRMYTDDGSGDGRFTPAGIELIRHISSTNSPPTQAYPPIETLAAPVTMLSASRQDLLQVDDALMNFARRICRFPCGKQIGRNTRIWWMTCTHHC